MMAMRRTMLDLLIVSETRLRDARISLSDASLTITRRPVELVGEGAPGCWGSSSDGMVSAGEMGRAGVNVPVGSWNGEERPE